MVVYLHEYQCLNAGYSTNTGIQISPVLTKEDTLSYLQFFVYLRNHRFFLLPRCQFTATLNDGMMNK